MDSSVQFSQSTGIPFFQQRDWSIARSRLKFLLLYGATTQVTKIYQFQACFLFIRGLQVPFIKVISSNESLSQVSMDCSNVHLEVLALLQNLN
jgi:hypothetical protein